MLYHHYRLWEKIEHVLIFSLCFSLFIAVFLFPYLFMINKQSLENQWIFFWPKFYSIPFRHALHSVYLMASESVCFMSEWALWSLFCRWQRQSHYVGSRNIYISLLTPMVLHQQTGKQKNADVLTVQPCAYDKYYVSTAALSVMVGVMSEWSCEELWCKSDVNCVSVRVLKFWSHQCYVSLIWKGLLWIFYVLCFSVALCWLGDCSLLLFIVYYKHHIFTTLSVKGPSYSVITALLCFKNSN